MSDNVLTNLKKVHDLSKSRDAELNKQLIELNKKIDEILTIIKIQKA